MGDVLDFKPRAKTLDKVEENLIITRSMYDGMLNVIKMSHESRCFWIDRSTKHFRDLEEIKKARLWDRIFNWRDICRL